MTARPLRVAMIGHAFMGAAHSAAWRTVGHVFELGRPVEMRLLCGRRDEAAAEAAARLGWAESGADWRVAVTRPDIDVVDICTPVSSHEEIAVAALASGKHVLCEKPLALDAAAAGRMAEAARSAAAQGVRSMLGHNYRRVPALALARTLLGSGRFGAVRHVRAAYLQDWGADPDLPVNWRFRAADGGSGALADLGSHLVDLVHTLTGQGISAVSAVTRTFIPERPSSAGGTEPVDVDDAVAWLAELDGGAVATFEASRVARGRKNGLRIEIFAERGSLAFDLERLNELELAEDGDDPETAGRRRVLVTEATHPYLAAWWPPGHVLGWDHSFVNQLRDFVAAVVAGEDPEPGFAGGERIQRVLDAVSRSDRERRWVQVAAG